MNISSLVIITYLMLANGSSSSSSNSLAENTLIWPNANRTTETNPINSNNSSQTNNIEDLDLSTILTQLSVINQKRVNESSSSSKSLPHHLFDALRSKASKLTKTFGQRAMTMPDPWPIETIQPKLVFYSRNRAELTFAYDANVRAAAAKLLATGFLDANRLVIVTHGFHNNFDTDWLHQYKEAIINASAANKYDQTVAVLGWGNGADILVFRYRQAASNVVPVGGWLAAFAEAIYALRPKLSIYGIGHSLGAHVMGVAGRTSKVFDRITGLDPAGPCFEKVPSSPTLRKSDAKFVDVIHTDGYDSKLDPSEWFFPVNHYGSLVPIATHDFYPNYGYHQPGAGTFTVAGSHLRSLELFGWSIANPGKFITTQVLAGTPDFDEPVDKAIDQGYAVEMGYYAAPLRSLPANASTLFYIKTNRQEPWV